MLTIPQAAGTRRMHGTDGRGSQRVYQMTQAIGGVYDTIEIPDNEMS